MKQKTGRKLLSVLLALAMVLGLMPGMSLTALAYDRNPYASLVNTTTTVTFNGKPWYIIADNSTAVDAGTVTLLAADTIYKSKFSSSSNKYSESDVNKYLGKLTEVNGEFADVADAIETITSLSTKDYNNSAVYDTVNNAKLYLLSTDEANNLPKNVLMCDTFYGGCMVASLGR